MKYIDAEKLKAEIEKNTPNHLMLMVYRDHILALIDSLQQEQQEEPDKSLEEELEKWRHEHFRGKRDGHYSGEYLERSSQLEIARHFAEWKERQMLKDAVEGYVNYYEDGGGILMAEAQVGCPYHNGDKVRIIICKKED